MLYCWSFMYQLHICQNLICDHSRHITQLFCLNDYPDISSQGRCWSSRYWLLRIFMLAVISSWDYCLVSPRHDLGCLGKKINLFINFKFRFLFGFILRLLFVCMFDFLFHFSVCPSFFIDVLKLLHLHSYTCLIFFLFFLSFWVHNFIFFCWYYLHI